jgi:hypothetical protein
MTRTEKKLDILFNNDKKSPIKDVQKSPNSILLRSNLSEKKMDIESKKYLKRNNTTMNENQVAYNAEQHKNKLNENETSSNSTTNNPNINKSSFGKHSENNSGKSKAKKRSNKRFHQLFPSLANSENVIESELDIFNFVKLFEINTFHFKQLIRVLMSNLSICFTVSCF